MASPRTTRRNFLITSMMAAGGVIGNTACQQTQTTTTAQVQPTSLSTASEPSAHSSPITSSLEIPQHILGRTEIKVPIFGLGGAGRTPLSRPDEEQDAIAIIERALDLGIRYFDTAASYGPSEERLGKVLPPHRANLFLASKTGHRDRDRAWRELEQSLQRLQTDYLDLWQFHGVTYDWDLDTLLNEKQGAIKAAEEARQQGLIRFIGITGHHNPAIIAEGLRRYPFDTALIPINAADKHTANPFITGVLPTARQHNTGVIAMKVPAYGRLIETGAVDGMRQAMGYALSQSGVHSCIIAAETVPQLEQNVAVAEAFQPLVADEMTAIEQQTAADWQNFSFFREWT
jgi:aryl-alcohol dehydrogenase-like predicted oxidoreductase